MSLMESGNAQSHTLALSLLQSLDEEIDPEALQDVVTDLPQLPQAQQGPASPTPGSKRRSIHEAIVRKSLDQAAGT